MARPSGPVDGTRIFEATMNRSILAAIALFALAAACRAESRNLISNGSFEDARAGRVLPTRG